MKKCCKKINKIKHTYYYCEEEECHETFVIKNNIETFYFIHKEWDEVESSYVGSNKFLKYYLFENNKLTEYNENTQI